MMQWQLTLNSVILGTTAGFALLIAIIMRNRRAAPGSRSIFYLLIAIAIWAGADALESAAIPISTKIWCAKVAYLGIASVPPLWFRFTLEYGRHFDRLTIRNRLLPWIVPLLTFVFAATNEWHHLVWPRIVPVGPEPGAEVTYHHGPWFWFAVIYNYALIAAGTVLLLRAIRRFPPHYYGQSVVLLFAAALPWIGNLLYLLGWSPIVGMDPTSVVFLLSGIAFAVGLARYRIFDLVPVARDLLIEAMRDGLIVVDQRRRIVDLNPAARYVLGLRQRSAIGQAAAHTLTDWPELAQRLQTTLDVNGEVQSSTQPPRTLDVQSIALHDNTGHPGGALLLLRDVTAARQAEIEIQRVQAFNERILQQMNEGIVVEDTNGILVFVNPAAAAMLGYQAEELVGLHWSTIVPALFHADVEAANKRRIQGIADRYEIEMVDRNGTSVVVQVTGSAQIDITTGTLVGTLAVFVDITEKKRTERALQEANSQLQSQLVATEALQAELREQAIRDPLTGLYNRRYLQETLEREVARVIRSHQSLSLVMIDIDHFKQVNDAYGHQAGDQMLRALGDILHQNTRRDDIACRLGGDEFVVMLAGMALDVAVSRAESWCRAFRDLHMLNDNHALHATLSAGIGVLPLHATNGTALLQSADQALYQAKAAGRNRVSVLNANPSRDTVDVV